MAYYPGTTPTFTTKTNKVDLVDDSHINDLQTEVVALATELGTNPSETRTTLKERLNSMMDADGSVVSSNGYPDGVVVPSYPSQLWYRTDTNTLYIRNAANTDWIQPGASLSNLCFSYTGVIDCTNGANEGEILTGSLKGTGTGQFRLLVRQTAAFATMLTHKWQKSSGVNTINVYARLWNNDTDSANAQVKVLIGAVSGTGVVLASVPTWVNFSMDVSGLVNGSVYDVYTQLYNNAGRLAYLSNIYGFSS